MDKNVMGTNVVRLSSVVVAAMLIGLVVGVTDARADDEIVAKVPFAFTVGTTHFAPGSYIVRSASEDLALMEIVSVDRAAAAFVMTVPGSAPRDAAQPPELVFTKIGNDYVLARLVSADGDNREFVEPHHHDVHESSGAAR
ncbi:MAG TPA: hypothetical protein VKE96_24775 [Vicinamibacterales bacterium]|nr:hypothetical protein [Vicinamibacterales bacterium]